MREEARSAELASSHGDAIKLSSQNCKPTILPCEEHLQCLLLDFVQHRRPTAV